MMKGLRKLKRRLKSSRETADRLRLRIRFRADTPCLKKADF